MDNSFTIADLTNNDNNYWRVDWFGYLHYTNKYGERLSEPLIDIYLSTFKEHPTSSSLNYKQSTDYSDSKIVLVPISYLLIIRLGDVWHKGQLYPLNHHKNMIEKFSNVKICNYTTETIVAGAKSSKGKYYIPYTYHPYHNQATQSYCEAVKLPSGHIAIFPHYVILQAYFSASQYVFQQLFKFGLQLDSIFDPSESYIDSDKNAFILLKNKTHDHAASQVARIAFDPKAKSVASNISLNLAAQKRNGQPRRLKAGFPFEDQTIDLNVYGKWCPLDSKRKVFIVFNILDCSAEYPFDDLRYFRDNPGDKAKENSAPQGAEHKTYSRKATPKIDKQDQLNLSPQEQPSDQIEQLLLNNRRGTRFSDLNKKKIIKQRQKQHKTANNVSQTGGNQNVSSGNTVDGISGGVGASVDFCLAPSEYKGKYTFRKKVCRLKLFTELLNQIEQCKRVINIECIQLFSELAGTTSAFSYFPTTYTSTGRKSTWQYINYIKGYSNSFEAMKHRRAIIAKISFANETCIYLIEAERRIAKAPNGWVELDSTSLLLAISHAKDIPPSILSTLLSRCTEERGTWDQSVLFNYSEPHSLKHAANSLVGSSQYFERQISIIEKHLGFNFD